MATHFSWPVPCFAFAQTWLHRPAPNAPDRTHASDWLAQRAPAPPWHRHCTPATAATRIWLAPHPPMGPSHAPGSCHRPHARDPGEQFGHPAHPAHHTQRPCIQHTRAWHTRPPRPARATANCNSLTHLLTPAAVRKTAPRKLAGNPRRGAVAHTPNTTNTRTTNAPP